MTNAGVKVLSEHKGAAAFFFAVLLAAVAVGLVLGAEPAKAAFPGRTGR